MSTKERRWQETRWAVLARDKHACRYCGAEAGTVDHLTPVTRGGSDDPDNLAAACNPCNSQKGNRTESEYRDWKARLDARVESLIAEVRAPWTSGLTEREIGLRLGARGIVPSPGRKNFSAYEVRTLRGGWRPHTVKP